MFFGLPGLFVFQKLPSLTFCNYFSPIPVLVEILIAAANFLANKVHHLSVMITSNTRFVLLTVIQVY